MKKILYLVFVASMLFGCVPGRWVSGNGQHFQQRSDAKWIKGHKGDIVKDRN
ncbi:MAG: hypothetical protein ABIN67_03475 [Ferruginibacter sp.]